MLFFFLALLVKQMNSWVTFYVNQCSIHGVETNTQLLNFFHQVLDVDDARPSIIDISRNYLGRRGFAAFLSVMETYASYMKELFLPDCELETDSILELASSRVMSFVIHVDVSRNNVCATGAAALISAVRRNPNIRSMKMDDAGVPRWLTLKLDRILMHRNNPSSVVDAAESSAPSPPCQNGGSTTELPSPEAPSPSPWPPCLQRVIHGLVPSIPVSVDEYVPYVKAVCSSLLFGLNDALLPHHQGECAVEAAEMGHWSTCAGLLQHLRKTHASSSCGARDGTTEKGVTEFLLTTSLVERHAMYWSSKARYLLEDESADPLPLEAFLEEELVRHCPTRLLAFLVFLAEVRGRNFIWDTEGLVIVTVDDQQKKSVVQILLEIVRDNFGTLEQHIQVHNAFTFWTTLYNHNDVVTKDTTLV